MIDQHILIVGGGIGGLTASLSLSQQGFQVTVLEQSLRLADIGAGVQLSPNCTRVLFDLGLEEMIRSVAFFPDAGEMRDWKTGKVIVRAALGQGVVTDYGFPYLHVHRADLISILEAAALDHSAIDLHTGAHVTSVAQTDIGVTAETTLNAQFSGDVLVGSDGIHSIVREALFGAAQPVFTGNIAWRALVPVDQLPKGLIRPMATAWWGPGAHFVHYYVRGGELVNCVGVREKPGWEIESWNEPGEYRELKADFSGWHSDIQTLIDSADRSSLFKWALFDRAPLQRWGQGRTTLLGDACHPTLPFMAQGAAMAVEDGAVLARCLRGDGSVAMRLQRYEDLRRARTARVQKGSRRNANIYHMRGLKARVRNLAAKAVPATTMKWLFSYDALSVDQADKSEVP